MKGQYGNITMEEIEEQEKLIDLENRDEKADAQRMMTWTTLMSMLFFPFLILIAAAFGLTSAVTVLSSIAPTYFASCAGIIMVFFGAEAYKNKDNS